MVSILEQLGNEQALADEFDVDDFTEMMDAYLPSFKNIDRLVECSVLIIFSL